MSIEWSIKLFPESLVESRLVLEGTELEATAVEGVELEAAESHGEKFRCKPRVIHRV